MGNGTKKYRSNKIIFARKIKEVVTLMNNREKEIKAKVLDESIDMLKIMKKSLFEEPQDDNPPFGYEIIPEGCRVPQNDVMFRKKNTYDEWQELRTWSLLPNSHERIDIIKANDLYHYARILRGREFFDKCLYPGIVFIHLSDVFLVTTTGIIAQDDYCVKRKKVLPEGASGTYSDELDTLCIKFMKIIHKPRQRKYD